MTVTKDRIDPVTGEKEEVTTTTKIKNTNQDKYDATGIPATKTTTSSSTSNNDTKYINE